MNMNSQADTELYVGEFVLPVHAIVANCLKLPAHLLVSPIGHLVLEEANEYVKQVVLEKKAKKIVKSKSMVTTEVDIDPMLLGLDDGKTICDGSSQSSICKMNSAKSVSITLTSSNPNNIGSPSIHKNREQIRQVFAKKLGYQGDNDPVNLARCAREVMRKFFLEAEIGITGCNFAIADSNLPGHYLLDTLIFSQKPDESVRDFYEYLGKQYVCTRSDAQILFGSGDWHYRL
jgi:hypothetical protein